MRKNLLKCIPVFLLIALFPAVSFAQDLVFVTGTVSDPKGAPLAGVQVVEKGATRATITDAKGEFTLKVANYDATLTFSSIGFETRNVALNGRTRVQIAMDEGSKALDEVVVIGYGATSKRDLTGSVSVVSNEIFNDRMVTSVEDALRGQVAGVKVSSTDGQPGAEFDVRIRGTGSLNATNAPLYVIDGITSETLDISSNDIQSMNILKDASATAIYGSRGANGVVIITTKQGQKGKTKVSFSGKLSVQQPVRLIKMMNSLQFTRMQYDINNLATTYLPANGNNTATRPNNVGFDWFQDSERGYYGYSPNSRDTYLRYLTTPNDPNNIYTDWQDLMMRSALVQNYNLTVSGGDEKGSFSLLGNFFNQDGIVINSGAQKFSGRFNFDKKIYSNAKLGLNVSAYHQMQDGWASNQANGVTMNMLAQPPTKSKNAEDIGDTSDDGGYTPENNNPWYQATHITKDISKDNYSFRGYVDWYLIPTLRLNLALNYSRINNLTKIYYPSDVNQGVNQHGVAQTNTLNNSNFTSENLLYWTPQLRNRDLRFDAMGGMTVEQSVRKGLNTETNNFYLENLRADAMQAGSINATISNTTPYNITMRSYLGRANLGYKDRYLFTATMRADGSSCFGANHRWGYFPSAALAWRASEERFIKHIREISNLKVRTSFGITGNTAIPPLQTKNAMSFSQYPFDGKNAETGVYTLRTENPDLKWESSIQYNAGVDFGLFKDRLTGTIDLYLKQTRDLLMQMPEFASTGYPIHWSNVAAVNNRGLEITLSGICIKTKNFSWTSDFNIAFNRSLVKNIGGASQMILDPSGSYGGLSYFAMLQVGKPVGNWYGYQTNGVYRSQSEIDALPDDYAQLGTVKKAVYPGYQRFINQNPPVPGGTAEENAGKDNLINASDRVILGCAEPKFTGGFNNSFFYRDFTLSIGLEFRYGSQIFNGTARYLSELRSSNRNQLASAADYWRPTLFDANTGALVDPGNELSNIRRPNAPQQMYCLDINVEDGSYLRINSVSLQYQIPSRTLRKIGFTRWSLFASVENLWTWTKYTGYDPDVSVVGGTYADLIPGLDFGSYPRARSYTFGMNFTF